MNRQPSPPTTLAAWIATEALPFSLDEPATFDTAVDRLVAALGDGVEILGMGEALHGGEELLTLRNRLFRRLVERHGYSAVAIESSYTRGRAVDEYVAGRGPATFEEVREVGLSHGFALLEANRDLIEWMRGYNADPAHGVNVRFYGFDAPTEAIGTESPGPILRHALDYLDRFGSRRGHRRRERIEALIGSDATWENPAVIMNPTLGVGLSAAAHELRAETEELISELRTRRPELVARGDGEAYAEALHQATIARQLLTYHAGLARPADTRQADLLGIRDAIMADNLGHIVARERGRGKVFAFAHNGHLQQQQVVWQLGPQRIAWWPAGAHLRAALGPRYAAIGSGLGESAANGIGQPEPGTLEALLARAPGSGRLLPTHRGQGPLAAALAALPTRAGSALNPSYAPFSPASFADFDWLLFIDTATYNRGAPPLRLWDPNAEATT